MESKKVTVKDYLQLFLNKNFVLILLIAMAAGFARKMCASPLTSHGMTIAGMTGTLMGISVTINKILSMVGRPVSGTSFDQFGCKKTLLISFVAQAVAYAFLSFTNNTVLWCVGKGLEGFCSAIQGGLIVALAVSIVGTSGRGLAITMMSAFPALIQNFAPQISKAIFDQTSYATALLVGAATYLIPAILAVFLDESEIQVHKQGRKARAPQGGQDQSWLKKLTSGLMLAVLPVCTMGFFANVAQDLNRNYIVQLGEVTGIDVTGGIAISGVLSFVMAIALGVIIDRLGTTLVLYLGYTLLAVSNLLYGFGTTQFMYTLAALAFAVGIAAYWPALQAMVFQVAGQGRQGAASSTLYLFLDVVALVFGTITGILYDMVGLQNVFKLVGFIVIIAIVYFTILKFAWLDKYIEKKTAEAAEAEQAKN